MVQKCLGHRQGRYLLQHGHSAGCSSKHRGSDSLRRIEIHAKRYRPGSLLA